MAHAGAGTLFSLSGGVLIPTALGAPAHEPAATPVPGVKPSVPVARPLFVQISDTHIGFSKEPNPDVNGTLSQVIRRVNAMHEPPGFVIHTGDITHFGRPEEFETAKYLLSRLHVRQIVSVPGEHDINDPGATEYLQHFGMPSRRRPYYSFDHAGVHFIGLVNVLDNDKNGLWKLGEEQLAWVEADLTGRSDSTPIVVFAHVPLWMIYEDWSWGTADADVLMAQLRRFGSVTVLNGHIHQIVQKVEGHITFHTARSTAFPLPPAGSVAKSGPVLVPPEQLPRMLGLTSVTVKRHPLALTLTDRTLAPATVHRRPPMSL